VQNECKEGFTKNRLNTNRTECMARYTNGLVNIWFGGWINVYKCGCMESWMKLSKFGRMTFRIEGCMNEFNHERAY
jgi:hypothetical protein